MPNYAQAYGDRGDFEFLPYDPRFPRVFGLLASLIRDEDEGLVVEHVGSTAVPGCSGQGVIDVLILVHGEDRLLNASRVIRHIGFEDHDFGQSYPGARGAIAHDGPLETV